MFESDRGENVSNIISQKIINNKNIEHHFRNSSLGAIFPERFNRTVRTLLKRTGFERGDENWVNLR